MDPEFAMTPMDELQTQVEPREEALALDGGGSSSTVADQLSKTATFSSVQKLFFSTSETLRFLAEERRS